MDGSRQREPDATSEAARHDLETSHDQSPTADGTEQTAEVTIEAEPCISLSDLSDEQLRGTFFTHAHNFGVSGGTFQSIKNMHIHHALPAEPDFPTIPMGYLNLLHELRLNADTGVVDRHQSPLRRAHSARIHGSESTMTVAIYEGDKGEENWREAISKHSNLRHPNIIQLFGTSRTSKIHAAIFHDELIPAQQMAEKYDVSPIGTVYFRYFLGSRSEPVRDYVATVSGHYPEEGACTLWIRPSTGGLCLDLTRDDFDFDYKHETVFEKSRHAATGDHLLEPNQDSDIIADMSLRHYHTTCYFDLSKRLKLSISAHTSLKLGAVYRDLGADCDSPVEVAFVPDLECTIWGWERPYNTITGQIMEDGWVCITSAEVDDTYTGSLYTAIRAENWLSQANHIFKCLDITSNYKDYAILDHVGYDLTFSRPTDGLPPGYLFLCPVRDLRSDGLIWFRHPDCPAYWSLDPTGVERLSTEEATDLGFPSFEFQVEARGYSWDSSVYEGLRQFHEAKGFDPYSQDVARHIGCKMYELSGVEGSSAYLEEINSEDEDDEAGHSEGPVQDIPSTASIQSQTPQFAPYPTHPGLDVEPPADRSFGMSLNHLRADTAFDLLSLPSLSTFSFPPPAPPHLAHLPHTSRTIKNPSPANYHPFNIPPTPPGQLDTIDPLNIPTRDRTVYKQEAESQSSARPHKKMRLDFIMGGGF